MNYKKIEQQNLDLNFRKEFEDFIVDFSNQNAFDWISNYNGFGGVLIGPKGCGKSHLSHIWVDKWCDNFNLKGVILSASDFADYEAMKVAKYYAFVVENVHMIFGNDCLNRYDIQKNFFHLYNFCLLNQKKLLLNSTLHVSNWIFDFSDIESRIKSLPIINMNAPSDNLLKIVIKKLFANLEIYVSDDIVNFIFYRIERSFEAAQNIVEFIVNISSMQKRSISLGFLKEILAYM